MQNEQDLERRQERAETQVQIRRHRDEVVQRDRKVKRRAAGLGWFSLALGAAQLFAPRGVGALAGVSDGARGRSAMRMIGAREIVTGLGILTREQPAPFVWSRVVGDVVDLVLLGRAWLSPRRDRSVVAGSMAVVAALTVLDVLTATQLSRPPQQRRPVIRTITVQGAPELVRALWDQGNPSTSQHLALRFSPSADGTATELRAEVLDATSGGALRGAIASKAGKTSPADVDRTLRHFKQIVETGEVLHSDASIHKKRHPARPSSSTDRPRLTTRHPDEQRGT